MKKKNIRFGLFLVAGLLTAGSGLAQKNPKADFQFPPLNKINMPKVEEVTLENGMKLFLVEDHDYPTIDLRAMIRTGSIYEPADKLGLASITGNVMRIGGSKKFPGDDLDKLLETLGATVETDISQGNGNVTLSLFKEDIDKGLDVLADLLMNPTFPEDKIDLAKVEERSMISRRNDDVGQIANREFDKLIYGADSPYAHHPEYATIDAVTRNDLIAFHKKYFHPNNMVIAVWGDFKVKELKKKMEKVFGAWKSAQLDIPPVPKVDYQYDFTVNYINKPDVNQANIMLGHIGTMRDNPDYPALVVMNQILSFDRMFKRVRTDEGLAYSVWGYYGAEWKHPGVFSSGCQTKSESTVKAIRIMLEEIKKIQTDEVTDKEINKAKDSFLNGFVFNFDSKAKIVRRLMNYDFYGYPRNYMDTLKEGVEKVTKADVLAVAKKYLRPDQVRILVVGKEEDFDEPLSVLGKVNTIDITIPTHEEEIAEATPEALEKGKQLLEKSIKALGGLDVIKKVQNLKTMVQLTQVTPMGEMDLRGEILVVYPDKMKAVITTPMGDVTMILNGNDGWMVVPGQETMPIPEAQKDGLKNALVRDMVFLASNLEDLRLQFLGTKSFNETEANDVLVSIGDTNFHLMLDPNSNLPVGMTYTEMGMQGPAEKMEIFSDYQKVGGFLQPAKTVTLANGEKESESLRTETLVNIEIAPTEFVKE